MKKRISFNRYLQNSIAFLKRNKPVVLTVIFLGILADVFLISGSSDARIFGILLLYVISIRLYKLRSRITFIVSLFLLGIMFVEFLLFGSSANTEKAAVWLVFFIASGIVQQWNEIS